MKTFELAHRPIGPEHLPLVVAEIGINHGGSLEVAKGMVRAAALAGCEIVKHQTHVLEDEMTPEAKTIYPHNADPSISVVMQA
ncbi:MAG: polyhydroxyalkanoate biosynthesis repressor PhaR, partial [Burkholderiaceae bacterium]